MNIIRLLALSHKHRVKSLTFRTTKTINKHVVGYVVVLKEFKYHIYLYWVYCITITTHHTNIISCAFT